MSKKIYCVDCKTLVGELSTGSKTLKKISYRCGDCENKLTQTAKTCSAINELFTNNKLNGRDRYL